jgi:hypothetical protein
MPDNLFLLPELPRCPYCGSAHVTRFDLDWIEVPEGALECLECGNAFRPEAWPKKALADDGEAG